MLCIRGTSHGPVSVCHSVRPSVTSQSSTKTAKRRITQTTPHDSPWDSSFQIPKISAKFDRGHSLQGHQMQVWWVKIGDFPQITGYISKTVGADKTDAWFLLKSNRKSYVLYRMVTLPMTLSAPKLPQTTPFSAFCTAIHSVVTGEPRDFKFGTLTYHSKSNLADEETSLKGAWSGSADPF